MTELPITQGLPPIQASPIVKEQSASTDLSIIGIICARGGSKGVPKKNIRPLAGKPLIAYSIETLKACRKIKRIIVSTDDPEIASVARAYGAEVPFLRPAELAGDKIQKAPALQHTIRFLEEQGQKIDIIIDLDPTSPLRTVEDIERCIDELQKPNTESVVTVYESHNTPYFNMLEFDSEGYLDLSKKPETIITCRQDSPKVYQMNSCVYAVWRDILMEKGTYFTGRLRGVVMPEERSIMIDTPLEFEIAELMLKKANPMPSEPEPTAHSSRYSPRNLFSLEGKVAIVTGAAGFLGREHCKTLLSAGAKVAIVDIDERANEFARELREQFGEDKACSIICDITNKESVQKMMQLVKSTFGAIHILLNNAAGRSPNFFAPFTEFPLEDWKQVMDVNLNGMFLCTQEVAKHMIEQKQGGSIINVSSIYGLVSPDPRIYEESDFNTPAIYSASKSGVVNFTRYLAVHLAKHDIRVNTLTPGGTFNNQHNGFVKRYCERTPLGRMAEKHDFAGTLLLLSSDASRYITGTNIVVDGGWTSW